MDENLEFHIKVTLENNFLILRFHILKYTWIRFAICLMVSLSFNVYPGLVSKTNLPVHEDKDRVPYVKVIFAVFSHSKP